QVTDPIPAGLSFVSATATQGSYSAVTSIWDVGVLAVGASATLHITVTVNVTTAVTNTASRSTSSPVDPNPANDSASATVTASTVPGLPNNGVPPVMAMWPLTLCPLFLIVAGLPPPRA